LVGSEIVMESSRRSFPRGLASVAGATTAATASAQHVHPAQAALRPAAATPPVPAGQLGPGVIPVVTPDVPDMPWTLENGVKVFHIRVEHVRTAFIPGRVVDAWGFNGSVPGPTIQVYGLRPGWSGGTMGMMTIVRVLKPELFDKIQELKAEQARKVEQR
jgi:hypothetical protein